MTASIDSTDTRGVLRDPELQSALDSDGYVPVPLLTRDEMAALVDGYNRIAPGDEDGLTIDYVRADRQTMSDVSDLLRPMFQRHLPRFFHDYEPIVATFIVKHPGATSSMLMHHEPTYVDETRFRTFNIWIPLTEITWDPPNGGIQLIPGTEALCAPFCGLNTPVLFRPYENTLRRHMVEVDVPVGSAIVYDTHMLHASGANLSTAPRPAIACALAPAEAPLIHTVATGRRTRQVYAVDREFFVATHPADLRETLTSRHEMVETREIEFALSPDIVADAIGIDPASVTQVCPLPDAVSTAIADTGASLNGEATISTVPCPLPDHDIGLRTDEPILDRELPEGLQTSGSGIASGSLESGSAGAFARFGVSDAQAEIGSHVLVCDEDAVAELSVDDSLACATLTVLDASEVAAGHFSRDTATQLVPGSELTLQPGQHLLWNDGPGPLVMIARTSLTSPDSTPPVAPTWRRRIGALLRR